MRFAIGSQVIFLTLLSVIGLQSDDNNVNDGNRRWDMTIHEANRLHDLLTQFSLKNGLECSYMGRLAGNGMGHRLGASSDLVWKISSPIKGEVKLPAERLNDPYWFSFCLIPTSKVEDHELQSVTEYAVRDRQYSVVLLSYADGLAVSETCLPGKHSIRTFLEKAIGDEEGKGEEAEGRKGDAANAEQ